MPPKPFKVIATETGVIDFFKNGLPIPAALAKREEDLRLPVFVQFTAVHADTVGGSSRRRVVLGIARKDVWFVEIRRTGVPVTLADAHALVVERALVAKKHRGRVVTGWLVTSGGVDEDAAVFAAKNNCCITGSALLR